MFKPHNIVDIFLMLLLIGVLVYMFRKEMEAHEETKEILIKIKDK